MYPNQPPQQPQQQPPQWQQQPPTQLPTDYLNQISPQAPKRSPFTFGIKQVLVLGGALIILVIIIAAVIGGANGGKKAPLERLSVRLTNTEAVANNAQTNLKSSQLRSLNASLKLYFTNTNRDIATPLVAAGITTKKIDKNIIASESTSAMTARLEDARLNAVYDRTYAREMAYQLGNTLTLMNQLYKTTKSESLKTFLSSAYTNLQPTQQAFANFTTTD